jgi:Secretion system C-terminal sorting domain
MKIFIKLCIILVFLAAVQVASAQFINIPSGITNPINTLIKYENHIFVGSNAGIITIMDTNFNIIKSTNSPALITDYYELNVVDWNHLYFFSIAPSGTLNHTVIYFSSDTGNTWVTKLDVTDSLFGQEFKMLDSLNGIILCTGSKSILTSNGFNNWQVGNGFIVPIKSASFGDRFVCTGILGNFLYSNDKGNSWQGSNGDFSTSGQALSLNYISASYIQVLYTNNSGIYFYGYSLDSGLNFSFKTFAPPKDIIPSDIISDSKFREFVVGRKAGTGNLIFTTDSFNTYTQINSTFSQFLRIVEVKQDKYLVGCASGQLFVFDINALSVADNLLKNKIIVYPNPASNTLTIENNSAQTIQLKCNSINGNLIYKKSILTNKEKIYTQSWAKGIYFISVSTDNKIVSTERIIIE